MKICLVSQEYPPETAHGGIAAQAFQKAHGLAELGHGVVVLSHGSGPDVRKHQDGAVQVVRIPGPDHRLPIRTESARWLAYSMEVAAALEALHQEHAFDLVEFPEYGAEGFVHLINREDGGGPPAVIHMHGPLVMLARVLGWPEPGSEFLRLGMVMEGACLRLADAVFSSSAYTARWCKEAYGIERDSIPVLHTGIDLEAFRRRGDFDTSNQTILFPGRVTRSKGADVLVAACLEIAGDFPGLRLRMLGRAEKGLPERLLKSAEEAGYPHLIDLAGFVPRERLAEEYSAALLCAGPSPCEGGPGFAYLESMACGLPVVACSGTGGEETVRDGETGFLVPPGDAAALAGVLRRMLSAPEQCRIMGQAARRFVEQHAETRACVGRIADFYRGVVEGARAHAETVC